MPYIDKNERKIKMFSIALMLIGLFVSPVLASTEQPVLDSPKQERGWYSYDYANIYVPAHSARENSHHYHGGSIAGGAYSTSVIPSYATNWYLNSNYCPEPYGGVVHVRVFNNEDYAITVYYTVWFYCN